VDEITAGSLNIFQSSDGQSIPFGSNWSSTIENALDSAKLMFVFVTPNSLNSKWIYFESVFSCAKKINVVPVGLGVDIALIGEPLSKLMGFNVNSADSLNNIIATINHDANRKAALEFTTDDYMHLIALQSEQGESSVDFVEVFESLNLYLWGSSFDSGDRDINVIENFFDNIECHLLKENIGIWSNIYASKHGNEYTEKIRLLFLGIEMVFKKNYKFVDSDKNRNPKGDTLYFNISPYNLKKSFECLASIFKLFPHEMEHTIQFLSNPHYNTVNSDIDLSAILTNYNDLYSIPQNPLVPAEIKYGSFEYKPKKIIFSTGMKNSYSGMTEYQEPRVLVVSFNFSNIDYLDIERFIGLMLNHGVIYSIENQTN